MLGQYVRVRITNPIRSVNRRFGFVYQLNFGAIEGKKRYDAVPRGAYVMGVNRPVRTFDGRVIAAIRRDDGGPTVYVTAPKNARFVNYQIEDAVAFAEKGVSHKLDCLYERSCGAAVYRIINGQVRYLLIKNRRSSHWGFPKGHVEKGETPEQTAIRETLEETGVRIQIIPQFASKSEYTIQDKVEKTVEIFLARTEDSQTTIQREEIEDYVWLDFDKAVKALRFVNDKNILKSARDFLVKQKLV